MQTALLHQAKEINRFDDNLNEYLLVINPAIEVYSKIVAEQQLFLSAWGEDLLRPLSPRITIASFIARETMEDTICRYMQRICMLQQSFEVALNNYSGIPLESVYLRIQDQKPFQRFAKELSVVAGYIKSCTCPKPSITSRPHIDIAGHFADAGTYQSVLSLFAKRSFHETFFVNELVLLRRTNQFEKYKINNVFRLPPAEKKF